MAWSDSLDNVPAGTYRSSLTHVPFADFPEALTVTDNDESATDQPDHDPDAALGPRELADRVMRRTKPWATPSAPDSTADLPDDHPRKLAARLRRSL